MRSFIIALGLALLPLAAAAQVSFNVKPPVSLWDYSTDIASIEIRLRGRLSTDSATTHKIIGRIKLAKWDLSLLTARATILVPATQTWEVKSLSVFIVPAAATGLASVEVILKNLPTSYTAPAGQQIAIDIGSKTGVGVIGPVSLAPPPPPPPPPSPTTNTEAVAPSGSLTTPQGTWTFGTATAAGGNALLLNGLNTGGGFGTKLVFTTSGVLYTFTLDGKWFSWTGTGWTQSAAPQ